MKMIWEASDIKAGTRIRNPSCKEVWIIGYNADHHGIKTPSFGVISLVDGMITINGKSAEQIAAFLNDAGSLPVALIGE